MLVSIPWQPELKLHPDALALLQAASKRVGRNLYLYNGDSAWRSYARQKALWDAYLAGGNIASNPDTGQRSHMRGAAFDLIDTSAAVQAACVAVGLKRDPKESWHWNHPNWANMPIIPADIPAPIVKDDIMATNFVDTSTYTNGAPTANTRCLTLWEGGRVEVYKRNPADPQEFAKTMFAAYGPHIETSKIVFDVLAKSNPISGGVDLSPVLTAIAAVPTAQQNGSAARTAIVK